jgi:hypothetical protein
MFLTQYLNGFNTSNTILAEKLGVSTRQLLNYKTGDPISASVLRQLRNIVSPPRYKWMALNAGVYRFLISTRDIIVCAEVVNHVKAIGPGPAFKLLNTIARDPLAEPPVGYLCNIILHDLPPFRQEQDMEEYLREGIDEAFPEYLLGPAIDTNRI